MRFMGLLLLCLLRRLDLFGKGGLLQRRLDSVLRQLGLSPMVSERDVLPWRRELSPFEDIRFRFSNSFFF